MEWDHRNLFWLTLGILMLGLILRLGLVHLAIQYGYVPDHFDNIGTGATAHQRGLLNIYSVTPDQLAIISGNVYHNDQFVPYSRRATTLPNYPPLGVLLNWLQVEILRWLDPTVSANTFWSRCVMGSGSFLAEVLTAMGVFLIVRRFSTLKTAFLAGTVCWLFPPIMMDSAFWQQVDSFLLAPTVFLIWCMLDRRWIWAGVCLGIALLLKPQGILLGPIVLYGAIVLAEPDRSVTFFMILSRMVKAGLTAILIVTIVTLPWMLTDGFAWFERSYVYSIIHAYPRTTLMAFNVWYLDLLRLDHQPVFNAIDSQAALLGLGKDIWGRLFVLIATGIGALLCWQTYKRWPIGLVVFSGLWLWNIFLFPTRVHERYVIYCMPLVLIWAACKRRFWPVVVGLAILGSAEMSWNVWLRLPAGAFSRERVTYYHSQMTQYYNQQTASLPTDQRPAAPSRGEAERLAWEDYRTARRSSEGKEWLATGLSLLMYLYAWIALFAFKPYRENAGGRKATQYQVV